METTSGKKPVVCYLGPPSSYTHQATLQQFPENEYELLPVGSIHDIFTTTQSGRAGHGVVPFENSTNGSVVFALSEFADRNGAYDNLRVCAEIYLDVHHCLLTNRKKNDSGCDKKAKTTTNTDGKIPYPRLYSHPQVWGQISTWLHAHVDPSTTKRIDTSSTSSAAELVAADLTGQSAAVASSLAAQMFDLDILQANIGDLPDGNTTRFFVLEGTSDPSSSFSPSPSSIETTKVKISNAHLKTRGGAKTLLSFTVSHARPGALAAVLAVLAAHGFDLTSITTQPRLGGAPSFEYIFFVEFRLRRPERGGGPEEVERGTRASIDEVTNGEEGKGEGDDIDKEIQRAMKELENIAEGLRLWGTWNGVR